MSKQEFIHIPEPSFSSNLTKRIIELDALRHKQLGGTTPKHLFFQLKDIFHFLESLGSARIEGNRTTVQEYIETKISPEEVVSESMKEIQNNEAVMDFVEEYDQKKPIDRAFISNLHKIIVDGLSPDHEGDQTPGGYRKKNVAIAGASHTPPDYTQVESLMEEFISFINADHQPQYDLLKTAIAHHRFAWIHPFTNGNGRTVRALTYAMLVRQGFNLEKGRIVNPTAVFCADRNKYYKMLAIADSGTDKGLLEWCEYMLDGLNREITSIDRLADYEYLRENILLPAVDISFKRKFIDSREKKILTVAVEKQIFQAGNVKHLFPNVAHTEISRYLRGMREKKLIRPITPNARKYVPEIANGYLLRGVMKALDEKGFLPLKNEVD